MRITLDLAFTNLEYAEGSLPLDQVALPAVLASFWPIERAARNEAPSPGRGSASKLDRATPISLSGILSSNYGTPTFTP